MGKGTDKLYITHSEWASEDAYSASAGSGLAKSKDADTTFKRLPFNFCAVSLQPFHDPVCTSDGTIFDINNILPWLEKHGTNPVSGRPLQVRELIKLHFVKNDEGDMVDPVTYKVFTNNTHMIALKPTGNVFAFDTVERLNIKPKMWRDLVSDEDFGRKDIITLQDPQNIESRNLSAFKYIQDGVSTLTPDQVRERSAAVNSSALGNAASMIKSESATPASSAPKVGKYLQHNAPAKGNSSLTEAKSPMNPPQSRPTQTTRAPLKQASHHTTGRAAASFTSTGLTPDTSAALATLTDEEYLLKHRRVKSSGYVRITIPPYGALTLELLPEFAPKAVWNFTKLARRGYYNHLTFHRNIRNFMLQGGDPTGTGRGGTSVWGKNFEDEFEGPLKHDARGMVSMANKGKDTNSSQFFITYRACGHLDRKHTIFGRVVEGMPVLDQIEKAEVTGEEKRPTQKLVMEEVTVLVDPFEEFLKKRDEREARETEEEMIRKAGGRDEDRTTWTGKRLRAAEGGGDAVPLVGKYMNRDPAPVEEVLEEWDRAEPVKKKVKAGGFGSFDSW